MFMFLFFFNDTATTEIYTLSLHDALPIWFYEHSGLDVWGTARALVTNVAAGSVRQGGATLTQQLVKQTLAQTADTAEQRQAATQGSLGRKLREARLAVWGVRGDSKNSVLT